MLKVITHCKLISALFVWLLVASCGGEKSEQTTHSETEDTSVVVKNELSAADLQIKPMTFSTKIHGQPVSDNQIVAAGQISQNNGIVYPQPNTEHRGNITLAIEVSDGQGLAAIFLANGDAEQSLVICEQDCGAEFIATISGINPLLMGWSPGQLNLRLVTVDNQANEQQVASTNIIWQPKHIDSIVAEINTNNQQLEISWATDDEFLWYNVYVANAPGITGKNIAELEGGVAQLGIRTKTVAFSNVSTDNTYYLVVIGVDGTGESAISSEIILVDGVDFTPPTAVADQFTVAEDTLLTGDLVANDFASGTNTFLISTTPVSSASHGQLTINIDGTFSYLPVENFHGTDQFSYLITSSNGQTAVAMVDITVTSVNDLPVGNADVYILDSELNVLSPGVLINDTDVDGDTLLVNLPLQTEPLYGDVIIESSGAFSYIPNDSFTTYDQFQYQITDGLSLSQPVVVEVRTSEFNGYPPLVRADNYDTTEETLLVVNATSGILVNDSDNDDDMSGLVISLESNTSNGVLLLGSDGSFSYQPDSEFAGVDFFSYRLTDPQNNSSIGVVTINVGSQNDAPIANNDQFVVANVGPVTIPSGLGLLVNDGDIDSNNIEVSLSNVSQPNSGTVVVDASGSFIYTSQPDFVGVDSFSYQVTDGNLLSNVATVQLQVKSAHGNTDDQTPISLDINDIVGDIPTSATFESVSATSGTAELEGNSIAYTPSNGFSGTVIITLQVQIADKVNNIQLVVDVTSENRAPVISSLDHVSINENLAGDTVIFTVVASDPDDDEVTFELVDLTDTFDIYQDSGEIVVMEPLQLDFESQASRTFTVYATDQFGATTSQSFTVNIMDIDEHPVLTSALQFELLENTAANTLVYQASGFDPEGKSVNFNLINSSDAFEVDPISGDIRIVNSDALDFEKTSSFSLFLQLNDDYLTTTYQISAVLLNVNEAPEVISASSFIINENTPNNTATDYTAMINPDPEGHDITWAIVEDAHQIFSIDSGTGLISVADNSALDFEFIESYELTISASETNGSPSNLSTSFTLTVYINDVDDDVDSDNDGLTDDYENNIGTNPNDPDSDDDGLLDGEEIEIGTNPLDEDSDDDLINDGDEVLAEQDPLNADLTPPLVMTISPSDMSTNICTNQRIIVEFNEQIRAYGINDDAIQLTTVNNEILDGFLVAVEGSSAVTFMASEPLPQSTEITIAVSSIKDVSGNIMASNVTSTFTTGTCIESDRPNVVIATPKLESENVPRNAIIEVVFDEPIDPTTITPYSFEVSDAMVSNYLTGDYVLSDDKTRVSFIPDELLPAGRNILVSLNNTIADLYGNTLATHQFNFETSFSIEDTALSIVSTSVYEQQQNVPLNSQFTVLFDRPINILDLSGLYLLDDSEQQVAVSVDINDNRDRVALIPNSALEANSSYEFVIDAIEDLAGNTLDEPVSILVETGQSADNEQSTIEYWSLPTNTQNVPLNPVLSVVLSEPVDPTTVRASSFSLHRSSTNESVESSISISDDQRTVSLTPSELLEPNENYYFIISSETIVTDIAGNRAVSYVVRYFTTSSTEQLSKPTIVESNVSDGLLAMPTNSEFEFYFDRPLDETCTLEEHVVLTANNVTVPISITLSSDKTHLEVTGENDFISNTNYRLALDGLCDISGNIMDPAIINFATGSDTSADFTRPSLISMTPVHQATDVALDANITMQFDEEVALNSTPQLVIDVVGTDIEVPGAFDVNGNTIIFTPSEPLIGSQRYRVNMSGKVMDFAGNTTNESSRYFDTVDMADNVKPQVDSISPMDGAIDVAPGSSEVVITFSEPMTLANLTSNNIVLYTEGEIIYPSVFRAADGRSVTLSMTLPPSQIVSIIMTEQITDIAGNNLDEFVSSFVTGPEQNITDRPSLVNQSPADGHLDVTEQHDIYFYFSHIIDAATIANGIIVTENGVPVPVSVSLEANGKTVKATYDDGFQPGALVESYILESILDINGNRVYPVDNYFYIESVDTFEGRPYVTAYSPSYGAESIPLNSQLLARFSESMDPRTFTTETVVLREVTGELFQQWPILDYAISFKDDNKTIIVTPSDLLEINKSYYLSFSDEIEDMGGELLTYGSAIYFDTSEDSVVDNRQPMVTSMSPSLGSTNIGTNATYVVSFDEPISELNFDQSQMENIQFSEDGKQIRYRYYAPLAPNSEHTEVIENVFDFAGNQVVPFSTSFTTADGPDLEPPVIIDQSFNNGEELPLNHQFSFEFNEPIDPLSIASNDNYIYENVDGYIEVTAELSADGRKLMITPIAPLKVLTRYSIYLYGVYDLNKNELASQSFYIDTELVDSLPPLSVVNATVKEGDVNIPTNTKLNVRFNNALAAGYESSIALLDSSGDVIQSSVTLSRNRTMLTVIPQQLLSELSQYKLTISGIEDAIGQRMATDFDVSFTTGTKTDVLSNSIQKWSLPANNITGIALNPLITVTFDERVDLATVDSDSFYIYDYPRSEKIATTWSVADDGKTLSIAPTESLRPDNRYYVYASYAPYITDLAGNRMAQNSYRYFVTGQEEDNAAPAVSAFSIAEGQASVPVNGIINVEFDEPIANGCFLGSDVTLSDGSVEHEIEVNLSLDRYSLEIESATTSLFSANTSYQLVVDNVCDNANNLSERATLNFTTLNSLDEDTDAPSLVSVSPEANATNISTELSSIVLVFDEPVSQTSQPSVVGAGITISGDYQVVDNTITFTPDVNLPANTQFAIDLYYTVEDLAGNSKSITTHYFETAFSNDTEAPVITSLSPADGNMDVNPETPITFSFNEPMAAATLLSDNISIFYEGSTVTTSIYRSIDGKEITLDANLPANALVTLIVNDQLTDLSGNAIEPFVASFITGPNPTDTSRPNIIQQTPITGTTELFDIDKVSFYASKEINVASLDDNIHVLEDGQLIEVDMSLSDNGKTIFVTKPGGFSPGKRVEFHFDEVRDVVGNLLYSYNSYIQMGSISDDIGVSPTIEAVYPDYYKKMPLNPVIMARFSEPLDESYINSDVVKFENTSNGTVELDASISLDDSGTVISIVPTQSLLQDTDYRVRFLAEITDTDGDEFDREQSLQFTTEENGVVDDVRPSIVNISPSDGSINVGINTKTTLQFDERINPIQFELVNPEAQNVRYTDSEKIVSYSRKTSLAPNTTHSIEVNAVTDISGNLVLPSEASFTTGDSADYAAPTLIDATIQNNQQDVPTNVVVKWQFDTAIDPISINSSGVYFWHTSDGLLDASWELSADGRILSVMPTTALTAGTTYYVYANSLQDINGNTGSSIYRYFTTAQESDVVAPTIVSHNIVNYDTNLPLNLHLTVRFDESVNVFDSQFVSLSDSHGENIPVNLTLSRDRSLLTVVPKRLLDKNELYEFSVEGIEDYSGNTLSTVHSVSFMTGIAVDVIETSVVNWSIPVNNTQDVPLNPLLQVTFAEAVDITSIDETTFNLVNNSTNTKVPTTTQISADHKTLTLVPESALEASTRYYFNVGTSPYLNDNAGNHLSKSGYRYFTTSDSVDAFAPEVVITNVADGSEQMPINGQIIISFDEPLSDSCPPQNSVSITSQLHTPNLDVNLSNDRQTLTIVNQDDYLVDTEYTVSISTLCDYAGNQFSAPTLLTFVTLDNDTADVTGPLLIDTDPLDDATAVPVANTIIIEYDEELDLRSAPIVKQGSSVVAGTYEVNGSIIEFVPDQNLAFDATYSIDLRYDVYDLAGNSRHNGVINFTTEVESF